jgi:hypothetical protein
MLTKFQFFFYITYNYTINFKGEKQVEMKTTGYKQLGVTVMLCITANVNKLPPHIILNTKTGQKNVLKGVIVQSQIKNSWMTSELIENWLGCV